MMRLKQLRTEKGVSQQKVADSIGSTQQSIHRYENGESEPDISMLSQLADYFDTSIDYLVGRTDMRRKIEPVEVYALNKDEMKLVDEVRNLSPGFRKCLASVIGALEEATESSQQ